jgi:hypothetical protein
MRIIRDEISTMYDQSVDFNYGCTSSMVSRQCKMISNNVPRKGIILHLQRWLIQVMNETTQSALLYAKFRSGAHPLKKVIAEIEQRSENEEYAALLNECYQRILGSARNLSPLLSRHELQKFQAQRILWPYVPSTT